MKIQYWLPLGTYCHTRNMNPVVLASIHHENILCNVTMTKEVLLERNVGQSGSLAAAPILPHFCSNLSCNYGIQTTDRPPSPPLLKVNGMEIPTLFEVYPIFSLQFWCIYTPEFHLCPSFNNSQVRGPRSDGQLAFSHFAGSPAPAPAQYPLRMCDPLPVA